MSSEVEDKQRFHQMKHDHRRRPSGQTPRRVINRAANRALPKYQPRARHRRQDTSANNLHLFVIAVILIIAMFQV